MTEPSPSLESTLAEPGCVFCAIVAGRSPAHVVLDEPDVLAFLDVRPLFPGHTLLVPRRHVEVLTDLPAERVGPYFVAAQRVAGAMESVLGAAGSFVAINNRVSQSVPHLHTHVVPRNRKDGLRDALDELRVAAEQRVQHQAADLAAADTAES